MFAGQRVTFTGRSQACVHDPTVDTFLVVADGTCYSPLTL